MKTKKGIIGDNLYMDERKKHNMVVLQHHDKLAKARDLIIIFLFGSILIESLTGIHLLGSWWK